MEPVDFHFIIILSSDGCINTREREGSMLRRRKKGGFTLLELIIVVIVIGIL